MKKTTIEENAHPITHPPMSASTREYLVDVLTEPQRSLMLRELERLSALELECALLKTVINGGQSHAVRIAATSIDLILQGRLTARGKHGACDPPMKLPEQNGIGRGFEPR